MTIEFLCCANFADLALGRGNETISIAELPVNAAAMPEDIEGILAKETDAFSIALGVTKLGKSKKALKSKKYEPKEKARRRGGISPSNSYVATFKDKEKDKEKRKRAVSLGPEIPLEKSTSKKLLEVPEDQPVKGSPSPNSSPSLTDSPTSSSPAKSKKCTSLFCSPPFALRFHVASSVTDIRHDDSCDGSVKCKDGAPAEAPEHLAGLDKSQARVTRNN